MSLTKEEASDLKFIVSEIVRCAQALRDAENANANAENRLENWLLAQQYPAKSRTATVTDLS